MINMAKSKIEANDETNLSEITISPDGRVFVFGASELLLNLFVEFGWRSGQEPVQTIRNEENNYAEHDSHN